MNTTTVIRPLIIVGILGVAFAPVLMPFVSAVLYPVSEWKKDAEIMRQGQEKKNCLQFINSKACAAPTDRMARWICSNNLSRSNCQRHVDVGYLILDEHKQKMDVTR